MASEGGRPFKLTIDVQFPAILHPGLRYHALLGAARQKLAAIIDGGRECQHRGGHVPIRIGLQNDETKAKQLIALCVCIWMGVDCLCVCSAKRDKGAAGKQAAGTCTWTVVKAGAGF